MKRTISLFLCLILLLTLIPLTAFADPPESVQSGSEKMYNYIKNKEGLRLEAYKNPGETYWTIGYGHCAPDIYEGMVITQEQADEYFRNDIAVFEAYVCKLSERYGYVFTQNEFDALLSLSYNFGSGWVEGYAGSWRLARYVKNGFRSVDPLELADSMSVICSAGGIIYDGLIIRRFEEAKILLYGVYPGDSESCPDFVYIKMDAGGGSIQGGNRVKAYYKDQPYGSLPTASKDGYIFNGWLNEKGEKITGSTVASENLSLTASWTQVTPTPDPSPSCAYGENCPSKAFADVGYGFWAHDSIDYVVANKLFNGVSTASFEPNTTMNRGMLVTVLYRLFGSPSVEGYENPFTDLEKNAYYDAILWASHNRIANGYADGTFRARETLTRQQLATFLCRYASFIGRDTDAEIHADLSRFNDSEGISSAYVYSLEWAVGQRIINGISAIELAPANSATRAQVATMLMRFMKNYLSIR